ncbi:MAG: N-acetylmuramoyl-L-alanine amidase [Oscillospiraceae bacterium]|nr:N-acetylmuramoyl-L-alanine amidase [Oscillospiraceae bacterium]
MQSAKKTVISIIIASTLIISAACLVYFNQELLFPQNGFGILEEPEQDDEYYQPAEIVSARPEEIRTAPNTIPTDMKAVYLIPGVDFYENPEMTEEQLEGQADEIINKLLSINFNTLIIDTFYENKVIYGSDILIRTEVDALAVFCKKAIDKGINIFAVHNIYAGVYEETETEIDQGIVINTPSSPVAVDFYDTDRLSKSVVVLTSEYHLSGIILDSYGLEKNPRSYHAYKELGTGQDYDDWLRDSNAYIVRNVSRKITETSNSVAVGLSVNAVWSNASSREGGSATSSSHQDYSGSYADTKMFVEEEYADFAVVKAFNAISDSSLGFGETVRWWDEVCTANQMNMFVSHAANKAGTSAPGFGGYTEIARQFSLAKEKESFSGSAFYTYKPLAADPNGSTGALLNYMAENYAVSDLFKELTVTSPKSITTTTYEDTVTFAGQFDPNFEVTINGQRIVTSREGEFSDTFALEIGNNFFTLSHKGSNVTYTVTKRVQIIQNINPGAGILKVDGETQLNLNVTAYSGAEITARFNGQTYRLTQGQNMDEDARLSAYVPFTASIKLPKASTTQDLNLGQVVVSGRFNIFSETPSNNGATVVINRYIPQIAADRQILVEREYVTVYNNRTLSVYSDADSYKMPRGTVDYIAGEVNINFNGVTYKYFRLHSGKRVLQSDVRVQEAGQHGDNALSNMRTVSDDRKTVISFDVKWKAPFNISFTDLEFGKGRTNVHAALDNYSLDEFNARNVVVTFDYAGSAPPIDESVFTAGPLFTDARWNSIVEESGLKKYILTLTLRKPGAYRGAYVYYDENGRMVFEFNNPKTTIEGMRIYLDAGHGGADPGAVGDYTGDDGFKVFVREDVLNYRLAETVKAKLANLGAIVEMPDTNAGKPASPRITPEQRANNGIAFRAELFISIHHNAAASPTASGTETHYNTPLSRNLAGKLTDSIASSTARPNRGNVFNQFRVTTEKKCPSVLLEIDFMSNPDALRILSTDDNREKTADAIVAGIVGYVTNN